MTVDGLQQSNSTNLIIKGIIALKAMSEIASALYLYNDSARYSVRDSYKVSIPAPITVPIIRPQHFAGVFLESWLSKTQLSKYAGRLPYDLSDGSSPSDRAQMYNLYPDKLLGTNLINETVHPQSMHVSVKC